MHYFLLIYIINNIYIMISLYLTLQINLTTYFHAFAVDSKSQRSKASYKIAFLFVVCTLVTYYFLSAFLFLPPVKYFSSKLSRFG